MRYRFPSLGAEMTMICTENTTLLKRLNESAAVRAIGNTPLLRLTRFCEHFGLSEKSEIWVKAEWSNPGGSVKDRPALSIVKNAFTTGALSSGKILLDSTSGNTGIAYAMLGAALGFPVELVVPESASSERKRILGAYGAKIIFSDPYDGSNGAMKLVLEVAKNDPERYYFADQYGNPANPEAHGRSTGPEIWSQSRGRITHFLACLGTTGTLMGTGRYLKSQNPAVQLVAVQPSEAFHGIEGLKHMPTSIVPAIYDEALPDMQVGVETEEAFDMSRALARLEGLFVGTSTGAALAAAVRIAKELGDNDEPTVIVLVAPDSGSKYLSTGLWSD
jgi:cysteine synthase B